MKEIYVSYAQGFVLMNTDVDEVAWWLLGKYLQFFIDDIRIISEGVVDFKEIM